MKNNLRCEAVALAAAFAALAAFSGGESVKTPTGLVFRPETVYRVRSDVKGAMDNHGKEWTSCREYFRHGNAPVRISVSNTTGKAQTFTAVFGFSPSSIWPESSFMVRIEHEAQSAPESVALLDFAVPFCGHMSQKHASGQGALAQVTDETGKTIALQNASFQNYYGTSHNRHHEREVAPNPLVELICGAHTVAATESISEEAFRSAYRAGMQETLKLDCGMELGFSLEKFDFGRLDSFHALSVFDAILIDVRDWSATSAGFKEALPAYVASGGLAVFVGENLPGRFAGLDSSPGADAAKAFPFALGKVILAPRKCVSGKNESFCHMFAGAFSDSKRIQNPYGTSTPIVSADAAAAKLEREIVAKTPSGKIVLLLLVFCILAGPVLAVFLARKNARIHILWAFPALAVVFTAALAVVVIATGGLKTKLWRNAYTIIDEKAGFAVTVQNDTIVSPFGFCETISVPYGPLTLVSHYSGSGDHYGRRIVAKDGRRGFSDGWTPSLWPVTIRTLTVRGAEGIDEESAKTSAVHSPLSRPHVDMGLEHVVERRVSK